MALPDDGRVASGLHLRVLYPASEKETEMKTLLAFLLLTLPAVAGPCENMPPSSAQREPDVPYHVVTAPAASIASWCHKDAARMTAVLWGCTYLKDASGQRALIVLSDALSPTDRACVLTYERAHLSPNNWLDPVIEATAPDDPAKVPS
jgi:hypothetical protein